MRLTSKQVGFCHQQHALRCLSHSHTRVRPLPIKFSHNQSSMITDFADVPRVRKVSKLRRPSHGCAQSQPTRPGPPIFRAHTDFVPHMFGFGICSPGGRDEESRLSSCSRLHPGSQDTTYAHILEARLLKSKRKCHGGPREAICLLLAVLVAAVSGPVVSSCDMMDCCFVAGNMSPVSATDEGSQGELP